MSLSPPPPVRVVVIDDSAVIRRALSDILSADPAVRFIVLDAAVMLEAGWHSVCQRLLPSQRVRKPKNSTLAFATGLPVTASAT